MRGRPHPCNRYQDYELETNKYAAADKEAKRIAAATWNKHHPDNPVTNKPHKKKK